MICGKVMPPIIKGGICSPCQEKVRREAMGEQASVRTQAEKELKRHGVTPNKGTEQK